MDIYIWILLIATVIGLAAFVVLHKEDGVIQRTTVYGQIYFTRTVLYINGFKYKEWTDASYTEGQVKQAKEEMHKEATMLYKELTRNNGSNKRNK